MTEPTIVRPQRIYLRSPGIGQAELVVQVFGQRDRIYSLSQPLLDRIARESNELHHKWSVSK